MGGIRKGNVRKLEVTAIVGRCERWRGERRRQDLVLLVLRGRGTL